MAIAADEQLFRDLKEGRLAPAYLLYGEERYFLSAACGRITALAVDPAFESFNLQTFEGEKLDLDALINACEALPMLSEHKCVVLRSLEPEKLSKPDFDRLAELLQAENESTVLMILLHEDVEMKKSARGKKLADLVKKVGGVTCEFARKDRTTLARALCDRAKRAHVRLDVATAGLLIDRCSNDYSVLAQELDKLAAYVGPAGEITGEAIDICCVRSMDSTAFDLAKSILSRNFERAFRLLDELFSLRQEGIMILGALSMSFADLYRAKCAIAAGKGEQEMAEDFRYPKNRGFAVRNAFRDVRGYSLEYLRRCMRLLYEADRKLKSSRAEERLILEQMLGKMMEAATWKKL